MATIDLGMVKGDKGVSIRNRGEWNATAQYLNNEQFIDMVIHNGSLWSCLATNTKVEPTSTSIQWGLSAEGVSVVYFTDATSRQNIVSGERTTISFGKIRKWFADLATSAFYSVANNLTTTAANMVLDARQGKALKDQVDSLNADYTATKSKMDYVNTAYESGYKDNLTEISVANKYSDINKGRYFQNPSQNAPVPGTFIGEWTCHWKSQSHVFVELLEFYPENGRRWTNFYNTDKWSGWKSIKPL